MRWTVLAYFNIFMLRKKVAISLATCCTGLKINRRISILFQYECN